MVTDGAKDAVVRQCFVIMAIGDDGSAERRQSDEVFSEIITPAVTGAGYPAPIRADQIGEPGKITNQIIQRLLTSSLVIADLSVPNENVYYELGVRHSTGLPVIQIKEDVKEMPFDLYDVRTIPFDLNIAKARRAISEITRHIMSLDDRPYEPPFKAAIDTVALTKSPRSQDQLMASVLDQLSKLQQSLDGLQQAQADQSKGDRAAFPLVGSAEDAIVLAKALQVRWPKEIVAIPVDPKGDASPQVIAVWDAFTLAWNISSPLQRTSLILHAQEALKSDNLRGYSALKALIARFLAESYAQWVHAKNSQAPRRATEVQ